MGDPGVRLPESHGLIAEAAGRRDYAEARRLLTGVGFPDFVSVSPEFFRDAWEEERAGDPRFLVITPDHRLAAPVMARAAGKFMQIGDDGRLYPTYESAMEADYSPNWVSDVYLRDEGLYVTTDCKGTFSPEMVSTMLDVLVRGFVEAGIPAHITDHHVPLNGEFWELIEQDEETI